MLTDKIEWVGDFTNEEKEEIAGLREGQVQSIKHSDAESYKDLCAEDVTLMLTGYDIVRGRNAFYEFERNFLEKIKVKEMELTPIVVKRLGSAVVEVGKQRFETFPDSFSPKGFKVKRKYMHILQKTSDGWRFSILMSNDSE